MAVSTLVLYEALAFGDRGVEVVDYVRPIVRVCQCVVHLSLSWVRCISWMMCQVENTHS